MKKKKKKRTEKASGGALNRHSLLAIRSRSALLTTRLPGPAHWAAPAAVSPSLQSAGITGFAKLERASRLARQAAIAIVALPAANPPTVLIVASDLAAALFVSPT